jgi:aspartate kinase
MIKNTLSNSQGTLITNCDKNRKYKEDKKDKIITAVAQIGKKTQMRIFFNGSAGDYEEDSYLFDMIANNSVSLDMINVYPDSKVFIIDENQLGKLRKILDDKNISYQFKQNCSKVTIIGNKMRGVPGVMAKVIRALSKCGIEILQTSDSHTTISCLIDSKYVNQAVNALHQEFELAYS